MASLTRASSTVATRWSLGVNSTRPAPCLLAGPDLAGHLPGLLVLDTPEDDTLVIHAVARRRSTRAELFGGA
jgi:hypothetical protein